MSVFCSDYVGVAGALFEKWVLLKVSFVLYYFKNISCTPEMLQ